LKGRGLAERRRGAFAGWLGWFLAWWMVEFCDFEVFDVFEVLKRFIKSVSST